MIVTRTTQSNNGNDKIIWGAKIECHDAKIMMTLWGHICTRESKPDFGPKH